MTSDPGATRLAWGIRASFREYLRGLDDTVVTSDGAAVEPGGFVFPSAGTPGAFRGWVRVTAHAGALDVTLAEPVIETRDGTVVLSARTGAGRIVVARLQDATDAESLTRDGGTVHDVALTLDGAVWLGGVYRPWTRMDPLEVRS